MELSEEIREVAEGAYETDEDMFSAVEDLVTNIRPQESGEMKSMSETREDYRKHLKSKAEKIYSGFKQFDEWAMLWRGWLYPCRRPSVGGKQQRHYNLPTVLQKTIQTVGVSSFSAQKWVRMNSKIAWFLTYPESITSA
ncbi:hypothetical protein P7H17_24030 [Paenibacillus larvae]|nr:hypothetical protein [Paenibacillus larvae]MDT2288501.1 hypothetical protein [Paenibacillus larvae]